MKKPYLVLFSLILTTAINAQPCNPGTASAVLNINNVNTTILGTGDMWSDLISAKYEVPKGGGASSIFAGAIWIGGLDAGGQLHTSAMTYRQNGVDFWPGPLDTVTVSTSSPVCNQYDRIWNLNRAMVAEFRLRYKDTSYTIPKDILEWPGNGDVSKGQSKNLAPYVDINHDGIYNPHDGDYPAFNFSGIPSCNGDYLLGDQCLWWIYNDKGNVHTETNGQAFGVEIQAQAFAYQNTGDIGNMTFYQYKITNRSANTYHQVYLGQWVDFDLGYFDDDFTQCDVQRGMGIGLNGTPIDGNGGPGTYGKHPPAIGVDFLGGPPASSPSDGKDSYGTSFVDPSGRIQMAKFTYYNNDFSVQGNPTNAQDYYNYLSGLWIDGTPFGYGGNAYKGSGPICDFMFPDSSDPKGLGTGGKPQPAWAEFSSPDNPTGDFPGDRRFLMSAGPYTMNPGEVQVVTIGVIWARDPNGTNFSSVKKLQQADDIAQQLYSHCFDTTLLCNIPAAVIQVKVNLFTATLSCPVTAPTYAWNFGDGNSSNLQNPSHTYTSPGRYTISLKLSYPCGADSTSQTITLYSSPHPLGVQLQRMEGQGNGGWVLDLLQESVDSIFSNPENRVLHPNYTTFGGPVYVDILDSALLTKGTYAIQFSDTSSTASWKLFRYGNNGKSTDTAYSVTSISIGGYQVIPNWGLAIQTQYVHQPGTNIDPTNGLLQTTMTFSNPANNWLTGLPDRDTTADDNWIRSGTFTSSGNPNNSPFDAYVGIDDYKFYQTALSGTWAPYRLCAYTDANQICTGGPANGKTIGFSNMEKTLAGIDVVLTSDQTKWTRCPVLELQEDTLFAENHAPKLSLRRSQSVDKNGNFATGIAPPSTDPNDPAYISRTGMGWFPGYAIDVETGERLNMAFGEDSGLPTENGRDMLWNPTSDIWDPTHTYPLFGGKHYIYIFGHIADQKLSATDHYLPNGPKNIPRYDAGLTAWELLNADVQSHGTTYSKVLFGDAMWVNIPLLNPGHSLFESDVKVRLRVDQPYRFGYTAKYGSLNPTSPAVIDTATGSFNKNFPLYNFETQNITTGIHQINSPQADVSVYPNPFDGQTTFVFNDEAAETLQLTLYDITGQKMLRYENITDKQFVLQCGSLSPGIYFYHILSNDGKTKIGKLVLK